MAIPQYILPAGLYSSILNPFKSTNLFQERQTPKHCCLLQGRARIKMAKLSQYSTYEPLEIARWPGFASLGDKYGNKSTQ